MASIVAWKGPRVLKGSSEPTLFGLTAGPKHPHTNMAKASLNMMTCSVADEFSKEGRLMGIGIFDMFKGYFGSHQPETCGRGDFRQKTLSFCRCCSGFRRHGLDFQNVPRLHAVAL